MPTRVCLLRLPATLWSEAHATCCPHTTAGRTEHIDEDLNAVLQELEKRRPADAPPIQPLAKSLDNVNGRGCNETAQGEGSGRGLAGCMQRAASLREHPLLQRRRTALPPYLALPSAAGGRSAAQEQYCDQAAYYTGRHEACFELVRHHYTADVAALKFGAADEAEAAVEEAAEAAAEAEAAVEDAAAEQRH